MARQKCQADLTHARWKLIKPLLPPITQFDEVHDKLMHLIVVSRDLRWFNHIHPSYKGNGVFTVAASLPGGRYKLYADHTPKDGK